MQIHSNNLAIEYAQKSVEANPLSNNKMLLTYAIANSGLQKLQSNDRVGAFPLFEAAITNFEAIASVNVATNSDMRSDIIKLYTQGAFVAAGLGKTNRADEWQQKATALMK